MASKLLVDGSSESTIAMEDLAMSELILGTLKSKDKSRQGRIHSSDFQRAITELGLPLGSPLVQDMLVHCKLDQVGNLDFGPLERELQSRRRIFESKPKPPPIQSASSSATLTSNILSSEDVQRRALMDKQPKLVKEYRQPLLDIFKRFSSGIDRSFGADAVVSELAGMGFSCSRAFRLLLDEKKGAGDVNFATFCNVLTNHDPTELCLDGAGVIAGKASLPSSQASSREEEPRLSKRVDHSARLRTQSRTITDPDSRPSLVDGLARTQKDAFYKNSQQVASIFACSATGGALLTHTQEQMLRGAGIAGGSSPSVNYTSEIRLQREQVLAAMRKLDSHVFTLDDFSAKIHELGLEVPLEVYRMVQDSATVGRLDWQKCIRIMDNTIFKVRALQQAPSSGAISAALRLLLQRLAQQHGASGLFNLETCFRNMQGINETALSFSEFRAGIFQFGLTVDDATLRCIFQSLDTNGDGALSMDELIQMLCPKVANKRMVLIRHSFTKLDRFGAGVVAIDDLVEGFAPQGHVDVKNGMKTTRQVVTEMVSALNVDQSDGTVDYGSFLHYHSSLSAMILSDDEFLAMMTACWGVTEKAPAPVIRLQTAGRSLVHSSQAVLPTAKQQYGDIIAWNQEESEHERQSRRPQKDLTRLAEQRKKDSDIIHWRSDRASITSSEADTGMRSISGKRQERLSAAFKSDSCLSNLVWSKDSAPPAQQIIARPLAPGDAPAAGTVTANRDRVRDGGNVRHTTKFSAAARRNYGGPTPYGISHEVSQRHIASHSSHYHCH